MTSELPGAAAAGRYVPILKAKEGEYKALADLRPDVKVAISPILEVPPIPWDYASDAPAKGLDAHIAPVIPKVAAAWGAGQVAYLDAGLVADERTAVGAHPVQALFGEARAAGLSLVPVSRIDGSADDLAAVAGVVVADGRGWLPPAPTRPAWTWSSTWGPAGGPGGDPHDRLVGGSADPAPTPRLEDGCGRRHRLPDLALWDARDGDHAARPRGVADPPGTARRRAPASSRLR